MKFCLATSSVVVALLMFSGCAMLQNQGKVTEAELASADFGSYPDNYKELIKQYYYHTMIDPNSAMFDYDGTPYKGYCDAQSLVPKAEAFGYGVTFKINGKNKLGGYVGWKRSTAYIRNNKVYIAEEDIRLEYGNDSMWVTPIDKIKVRKTSE